MSEPKPKAEPDDERMEELPDEYIDRMHEFAEQQNIDSLLQDYDATFEENPDWEGIRGKNEPLDWQDLGALESHRGDYMDVWSMGAAAYEEYHDQATHYGTQTDDMAAPEEMTGTPGTRFWDGRLQVETNSEYAPFNLRGRRGNPGFLQEVYKKEPTVRDAVDSIKEIQMAADQFLTIPKKDKLDSSQQDELRDWVQTMEKAFANLEEPGSWNNYVAEAAMGVPKFGFMPFEVTWRQMDGYWVPKSIEERMPSNVYQWVLNDRKSRWMGTKFEPPDGSMYVLSHQGPRVRDTTVINPRVGGQGLNLEGVAPARTAAHWIKFKKLLGQIAAATAQKYGVPITYIKVMPEVIDLIQTATRGDTDEGDVVDKVVNKLNQMQAVEAPVVGLPDGLDADLQAPPGQMPNFLDLIRYCDEQIAKCFSSEGTLIGHNDVGSYALAEVKDNRFMRSAPAWHRIIFRPINKLIKRMVKRDLGEMPAYPEVGFQLNALQDTSSFIKDMSELFDPNSSIPQWPEGVQKAIARQMGVEVDTFSGTDDHPPHGQRIGDPGGRPDGDKGEPVQGNIGSPQSADPQNQPNGQNPTNASGNASQDMGAPEDVEAEAWMDLQAERFDADKASRAIDDIEDRIAQDLYELVQEQKERFEAETTDILAARELQEATEVVADEFRSQYEDIFVEGINDLIAEGMAGLLDEFGIQVPDILEAQAVDPARIQTPDGLPPLPEDHRQRLGALATGLRDDLTDRNARRMRNQKQNQLDEDPEDRDGIDALALTTVAALATQVGGPAYNVGRDTMIQGAKDNIEQRTGKEPRIKAVRSTRMDGNVCPNCAELEFKSGGPTYVAGSSEYYSVFPPKPCFAGDACRCVFIYQYPQGLEGALRRIIGQTPGAAGSSPDITFQNTAPVN